MKITIYKHNSINVQIDDDLQKVVEYYNSDFVKQYINEPISFTIQNTSLNLKDIPLEGECVMVVYKTGTFPVYGHTFPPLNGTILIYVSVNQTEDKIDYSWKVMVHEILHAIMYKVMAEKKIYIPNVLDRPIINGVATPYYKNENPYALDGNFSIALKALSPYYKKEVGYKYFSNKEVKFLDLKPSFMQLVDNARGFAGIPFKATSGRRTAILNKEVGGSPTSAHLDGTGIDIESTNWAEVHKIVFGAMQAGIPGITVYAKSSHVHLDMKSTRLEVLSK